MSKPWLEDWRPKETYNIAYPDERLREVGRVRVEDGSEQTIGRFAADQGMYEPREAECVLIDRGRARLAAAAPALVRALLAVEWGGCADCYDGGHPVCPECNGDGPGVYISGPPPHDHIGQHAKGCDLDELLTHIGLPDQASRDESRAEIAKLAKETAR